MQFERKFFFRLSFILYCVTLCFFGAIRFNILLYFQLEAMARIYTIFVALGETYSNYTHWRALFLYTLMIYENDK